MNAVFLFAALKIDTYHNSIECRYAECRYVECRYAECRYAECRGAFSRPTS